MADLNQYLNQGLSADDMAHTNGYGVVAGGGGAGGLSMEQRKQLLNQPRVVGSYRYSRLGRQGSSYAGRTLDGQRRTYDPSTDKFGTLSSKGKRQGNSVADQQHKDAQSITRRQSAAAPKTNRFGKYA